LTAPSDRETRMKIGLMADSHDHLTMIAKALDIFEQEGVECIVHAGDYVAPFALKALVESGKQILGVYGNNDGERAGLSRLGANLHEEPHLFVLAGRRLLVAHDETRITTEQKQKADIVLVGHTHNTVVEAGPPMVINPGETCSWLTAHGTVVILDSDTLDVRVVTLASA